MSSRKGEVDNYIGWALNYWGMYRLALIGVTGTKQARYRGSSEGSQYTKKMLKDLSEEADEKWIRRVKREGKRGVKKKLEKQGRLFMCHTKHTQIAGKAGGKNLRLYFGGTWGGIML